MSAIGKTPAVKRSSAAKPAAAAAAAKAPPRRSGNTSGNGAPADRLPAQAALAPAPASDPRPGTQRRKRLAKAFERPLDKVLRKQSSELDEPAKEPATVRDGFTFPKPEHDLLVEIKKRLAEQGVTVKKSDLIRVGLILLSSLSQEKLKGHLARLTPVN